MDATKLPQSMTMPRLTRRRSTAALKGQNGASLPKNMNPFFFPPRGRGRPTLHQVLSEPNLRREFMCAEAEREPIHDHRQTMASMRELLDEQAEWRENDFRKRIETEEALIRSKEQHRAAEAAGRVGNQRPAWTYNDPADYFEKPRIDSGPSLTFHKNDLLMGMFEDPETKPPHFEFNVPGGWNPHSHNLRGQILDVFGDKLPHQLEPKEVMYKQRLERKLAKANKLEKQDALNKTSGFIKKKIIEETAQEFSSLKRSKPAWQDQQVTTHEIFMPIDSYLPGDHIYETGMPEHIRQPERALSFERNVIAGDGERKSFWKAPQAGAVKGTQVRAMKAKALLCPRGCPEMRATIMRKSKSLGLMKSNSQSIPLVAAR